MRAFKDEIKYFLSKFPTGSWARAFGIVAVCLTCLAVPAVIADSIGLLYLYSFDRDPKKLDELNLILFPSDCGRTGGARLIDCKRRCGQKEQRKSGLRSPLRIDSCGHKAVRATRLSSRRGR